jgi:hypothetical protein
VRCSVDRPSRRLPHVGPRRCGQRAFPARPSKHPCPLFCPLARGTMCGGGGQVFPGRRPHNIPPPLPRALVAGSWLARGRSDDDASRGTDDGGRQRARMVGAAFSGDRACLACVWWAGPARRDALALRLCTSSQLVGETASHSPWRTMSDVMRSALPARSSRQSNSRSCPSDQAPATSSSSSSGADLHRLVRPRSSR